MANFYKNSDKLCEHNNRNLSVKGVEYHFITDLATEPVTLADFKKHSRIDWNMDDELCVKYIKAARQHLEKIAQLSFGERTVQMTAIEMIDNWKVMYGPVDNVKPPHKKFGKDIIVNSGGKHVTIEYTTKWVGGLPMDIEVAIMRYAAYLYAVRESIILTEKGNVIDLDGLKDDAENMVKKWGNVTFL